LHLFLAFIAYRFAVECILDVEGNGLLTKHPGVVLELCDLLPQDGASRALKKHCPGPLPNSLSAAMDRLGRDSIELILELCAPVDAAFFAFTSREIAWAADYDLMVYDGFFHNRHNPDHCRLCLWLLRDFEPGGCMVCYSPRLCADCIVPVAGRPCGTSVCWWYAGPDWDHLLPERQRGLRRRFTTAWWYLIREDLDWSEDEPL
jgi:hypothetical protein